MNRIPSGLAIACVLGFASALGGCTAFNLTRSETDPQWVEVPVHTVDRENLHEACCHALEFNHLQIEESKVAEGTIRTKWSEDLFTFARTWQEGGGMRRRAFVEIKTTGEDTQASKQGYERLVRVRVQRQKNMEHKKTMDAAAVKWEPDDDDVQLARGIAVTVQSLLTEFRPSNDFYRRHGMTPPDKSAAGSRDTP